MFEWLPEVAGQIRNEMTSIYWVMLTPYAMFSIAMEFFKVPESNPNVTGIIKRILTSMIMLFTFDMCISTLGMAADGITHRIDGIQTLPDLLNELWEKHEGNDDIIFGIRDALIYGLHLLSYIIALVGVFTANILIKFVWTVLYVVSPLMILMYVSHNTSFITKNLYKGLLNVVSWKILWSILGVMLLKFATIPEDTTWDNQIMNILVNLCIGVSMLFIPLAAKSLLTDGMSSAANMMAAVPAMAAYKSTYGLAADKMKQAGKATVSRSVEGFKTGFRKVMNNENSEPTKNKISRSDQAKVQNRAKFSKSHNKTNLTK